MHESMQLSLWEDYFLFVGGGLFLEPAISNSLINSVSMSCLSRRSNLYPKLKCRSSKRLGFLSVSLSESFEKKEEEEEEEIAMKEEEEEEEIAMKEKKKVVKIRGVGAGAMNTTKHLWAGAVATMVSRSTCDKIYGAWSASTYNLYFICQEDQKVKFWSTFYHGLC